MDKNRLEIAVVPVAGLEQECFQPLDQFQKEDATNS